MNREERAKFYRDAYEQGRFDEKIESIYKIGRYEEKEILRSVKYDQVKIGVVTDNKEEMRSYFKLFKLMLKDKLIEWREQRDNCLIKTNDFHIHFVIKSLNQRGWRNHYILNLTQDEEYHNTCVAPKTLILDYLKEDERWSELF